MGNLRLNKYIYFLITILIASITFGSSASAYAAVNNDSLNFGYPLKNHVVVKKFVAPKTIYSAGHRGVDFYAPSATAVFSVAQGRVIFAGYVAGSLHITVLHGKDYKSTYTYLATKTVKVGDEVKKGQLLGTTAGKYHPSGINSFLFTLRYKNQYVDPMLYLQGNMIPREIRLGEIQKPGKSLLQRYIEFEKRQLDNLIKSTKNIVDLGVDSFRDFQNFSEWMTNEGTVILQKSGDALTKAYEKTEALILQMKDLTKQIARDTLKGLKSKVEQGLKKLHELEKKVIKYIKATFDAALKLSKSIAQYYAIALKYGVDAGKWFLQTIGDFTFLPARNMVSLARGIIDLVKSAGTTSLKLLHQYLEVDVAMMLRTIVLPGSCLFWSCSQTIELKCNPFASFKLRTKADGFIGSKNEVLVVSGINTDGKVDKKSGKMKQTVDIPVDDLGYTKKDVTYYSYAGEGNDFNKKTTYQDLRISAKHMDDQIKSWKIKNAGEELDLITHSMGGAVTAMWLAEFYNSKDTSYPELGKVVMLAPPLSGTALATAGQTIDSVDDGRAFHDNLSAFQDGVPAPDDMSIKQMVEDGDLEKTIAKTGAMKKVKVYAIRLPSDNIVTSASDPTDGVEEIILNNWSPSPDPVYAWNKLVMAHFDIKTNKKVISSVQHILEGSKPPCEPIWNSISTVKQASIVHASEVITSGYIRNTADAWAVEDINRFVGSFSGS